MDTYEKKSITKIENVLVSTTCDACKSKMPLYSGRGAYRVEVQRTYSDYDGGGHAESYDICNKCWDDVIIKTLGQPSGSCDF